MRYGVAPDHQGTKAVSRQFERLFEREEIHFLGNLDIGRDLSLTDLRAAFDLVVLATGLYGDRELGVPGEELDGVHRSGRLTRLWNAHPDEQGFAPRLGKRVTIVGNGNVAIDILRLLAKSATDFDGSDIADEPLAALLAEDVQHIDIVGRSPAAQGKFDPVMLRELGKLGQVRFQVEDLPQAITSFSPAEAARLDVLLDLEEGSRAANGKQVTFHFGWIPQAIEGRQRVEAIRFGSADGEHELRIETDSVITAIGFSEGEDAALRRDELVSARADLEQGRLDDGLYCVGWFKRGPRGTIPENRADARLVADTIVAAVEQGQLKTGKPGLPALPPAIRAQCVPYAGWKLIDAAEQQGAAPGRVRRKIGDRRDMLAIAQSQ
ncbi:NADPH-ferredoxin reductase FprA [compost metagenome]